MWLALIVTTAALTALSWRDRLAAAEFGLGGFPFNISPRDYYDLLSPAQSSTLLLFFVLWVFLSGGIIDRLARDARASGVHFFAACGACFAPLLRLALVTLAAYWVMLTYVTPALARVADGASETTQLVLYGVLATLLFAVSITLDYARVRLVIEDRRSAIGAIAASLRMLRSHAGRILGIQAIFWLLLVFWIGVRNVLTQQALQTYGAGGGATLVLLFAAGELLLKLSLTGAQVSLYQQPLGPAGWVARQAPAWPDDASADPAGL